MHLCTARRATKRNSRRQSWQDVAAVSGVVGVHREVGSMEGRKWQLDQNLLDPDHDAKRRDLIDYSIEHSRLTTP
jgi:hypothetical protein